MPIALPLYEICREILMDSEVLVKSPLTLFHTPLGGIGLNGQTKSFRDTNMWMHGMLPSPDKFVVTGIKCVFLEPDGALLPMSHPLYWDSQIGFFIANKRYWESPIASVIDPMLLTSTEEWNKLDLDRKAVLMRRFCNQFVDNEIPADKILVPAFPQDKRAEIGNPQLMGVLIESQQPFSVRIEHPGKWPLIRILCVLQGTNWRPVL
jgi:hypothetical protein